MKKLLAALGLVGVLLGCQKEESKELKLWGYVEARPRIILSNSLVANRTFSPNLIYLSIKLDCSRDYACKDLDLKYHGENSVLNRINAELEIGDNIPSLTKGDAVYFSLSKGFTKTNKTVVGDPLYWINSSPVRGKLLEYLPTDK